MSSKIIADLDANGYAVVPGCISEVDCKDHVESVWNWLEAFPYGFKRDDKSTWDADHMPTQFNGLIGPYAVNHEDFLWKLRTNPGVQQPFKDLWGTDDLIVSFDGMNASLPLGEHGRKDLKPQSPWPHIDRHPAQVAERQVVQGIANVTPSGPDDGGLCVMAGSHNLHSKYFKEIGLDEKRINNQGDGYRFQEEDLEWYEKNGGKRTKICAPAGSVILWDSRTIHWNAAPIGSQQRFISYVSYMPRSSMSEEQLKEKYQVFKRRQGTGHNAHRNPKPVQPGPPATRPDGSIDHSARTMPVNPPQETELLLRLVGAN